MLSNCCGCSQIIEPNEILVSLVAPPYFRTSLFVLLSSILTTRPAQSYVKKNPLTAQSFQFFSFSQQFSLILFEQGETVIFSYGNCLCLGGIFTSFLHNLTLEKD